MSIGYLGYARIGNIFLLCNSAGVNRVVNPLISQAVWGGGWYNAAETNYADSQQNYEGNISFELQSFDNVWNTVADWIVEDRVRSQSFSISPNGIVEHFYTKTDDYRSGAWASSASLNIDPGSLIAVNCGVTALVRTEVANSNDYYNLRIGPGFPTRPLNPVEGGKKNLNPVPGWNARAIITWPGAPPAWSEVNTNGFVLMNGSVNINNNTQIIRGCSGNPNPVAVLQGQQIVDGSLSLWRNGPILDPYGDADIVTNSSFTAENASLTLSLGDIREIKVRHILFTSDAFDIQNPNSPTMRTFGFKGLGDGVNPPIEFVKV